MKNLIYIFALALAIVFVSCTEKIDLQLEETFTRLVVEATLTTDTMEHIVKLHKTTDYFNPQQSPAVTGAQITISTNDQIIELTESSEGIYKTNSDVFGLVGKTYQLSIELAEEINNSTHYEASSIINPVAVIDSIGMEYNPVWDFWIIKCYAWDPPSREFYMFNIYKNDTLITDTINEAIYTEDRFYNGNYTNGIGVGYLDNSRADEAIRNNDIITFKMSSITEAYYNFLIELNTESGYSNPLFGGPPANVKSNLSNGAIGFFASYSNAYSSRVATGIEL